MPALLHRPSRHSVLAALGQGHADGFQVLYTDVLRGTLSGTWELYHHDVGAVLYAAVDVREPSDAFVGAVRRLAWRCVPPCPLLSPTRSIGGRGRDGRNVIVRRSAPIPVSEGAGPLEEGQ